jgi:hypothetical protein
MNFPAHVHRRETFLQTERHTLTDTQGRSLRFEQAHTTVRYIRATNRRGQLNRLTLTTLRHTVHGVGFSFSNTSRETVVRWSRRQVELQRQSASSCCVAWQNQSVRFQHSYQPCYGPVTDEMDYFSTQG